LSLPCRGKRLEESSNQKRGRPSSFSITTDGSSVKACCPGSSGHGPAAVTKLLVGQERNEEESKDSSQLEEQANDPLPGLG
jgi:hypothetical protein